MLLNHVFRHDNRAVSYNQRQVGHRDVHGDSQRVVIQAGNAKLRQVGDSAIVDGFGVADSVQIPGMGVGLLGINESNWQDATDAVG